MPPDPKRGLDSAEELRLLAIVRGAPWLTLEARLRIAVFRRRTIWSGNEAALRHRAVASILQLGIRLHNPKALEIIDTETLLTAAIKD